MQLTYKYVLMCVENKYHEKVKIYFHQSKCTLNRPTGRKMKERLNSPLRRRRFVLAPAVGCSAVGCSIVGCSAVSGAPNTGRCRTFPEAAGSTPTHSTTTTTTTTTTTGGGGGGGSRLLLSLRSPKNIFWKIYI